MGGRAAENRQRRIPGADIQGLEVGAGTLGANFASHRARRDVDRAEYHAVMQALLDREDRFADNPYLPTIPPLPAAHAARAVPEVLLSQLPCVRDRHSPISE